MNLVRVVAVSHRRADIDIIPHSLAGLVLLAIDGSVRGLGLFGG